MNVGEKISPAAAAHPQAPPEPYSAEWWEARTAAELRDIIKRGFGMGQVYDGAVLEAERRAREATRRLRQQAEQEKAWNRLTALAVMLAVLVVATIVIWGLSRT
jgi:hypothetical protein